MLLNVPYSKTTIDRHGYRKKTAIVEAVNVLKKKYRYEYMDTDGLDNPR